MLLCSIFPSRNAQVSSKITALTDLTKDANDSLTNALEYTRNASALLDLTTKELEEVGKYTYVFFVPVFVCLRLYLNNSIIFF